MLGGKMNQKEYNKEKSKIYNKLLNEIGKLVNDAERELKKLNNWDS